METTPAQFRLLIVGDGTVRTLPMHGTSWMIGRATGCTVTLRDPTVSRQHVLIERLGGEFHFRDLSGSNPVLLDGKAAKQGVLAVGQTLSLGMTRLAIQARDRSTQPMPRNGATVVLSREVIDQELATPSTSSTTTVARVLDRMEWMFADLGNLTDAAEPLLTLAMNLSRRRMGWIGRLNPDGDVDTLTSVSTIPSREIRLPENVLVEARRIAQPHLLTTQEDDVSHNRLVVPLGKGPEGLLVLEAPEPDAPQGQDLLHLAQSLSTMVWHRLQETTERLRLCEELQRLRFHGSATHNALLASARLNEIRQTLRAVASGARPILLVGEEGTEREELARYLHAESPRRQAPFLPWDAGRVRALRHDRDLLGDGRDRGLLRRCAGGTVFLDNAQELSTELLTRIADRLAGDELAEPPALVLAVPPQPAIAWPEPIATELAGERLQIPPLRSEPRDVLALAELFLSEMGSAPHGGPRLLTERTKRALAAYPWPGNVRELRLVLEVAAAQAGDEPIAPRHLPAPLANDPQAALPEVATLEEVERQHILTVMARTGGNRSRAAQMLGIASSTLYEKLKRYGLGD